VLLLPDRNRGFDLVDQLCAGGQGGLPVRRTDDHDHSQVPDLKVADTVLDCDPDHVMLSRHSSGTLGQYGVSAGVITVVERVDSAPLIAAAYDTQKDAYSTDLRGRHRSDELVHTERGVSDASQSDLRKHPQTLAEPGRIPDSRKDCAVSDPASNPPCSAGRTRTVEQVHRGQELA
jgi:hypothetical protein